MSKFELLGGKGFFGSISNATSASRNPKKVIIKKRPVSFERRFLSVKERSGKGNLEVALVWRDQVLKLEEFTSRKKNVVTIGSDASCDFNAADVRFGAKHALLKRADDGIWSLFFSADMDGCLVVDENVFGKQKIAFKDVAPDVSKNILNHAGMFSIPIDGMTRAKIVFGDGAAILVRMSQANVSIAPATAFNLMNSMSGSVVASVFIHVALLSLLLLSTDRVEALMVDRILTSSRFAEALIQPEETLEALDEDKADEIEPEDPEEIDSDVFEAPSVMATNTARPIPGSNSGSGTSSGNAVALAQRSGLLAQRNVMNSMLAIGQNLDNVGDDWTKFDPTIAKANNDYLAMTTSGGDRLGDWLTNDSLGPNGNGINPSLRGIARQHTVVIPEKGRVVPRPPIGNPEVSGSIDKRQIQRVVKLHTGEIRACYERELTKNKGLNGKVAVTFLISADGSVASALVTESTLKNQNVHECMISSIKRWRFSAPKGGRMTKVVYPFLFQTGSAE